MQKRHLVIAGICLFFAIGFIYFEAVEEVTPLNEVEVHFLGGKSEEGLFSEDYFAYITMPATNSYYKMPISSVEYANLIDFENGTYQTNGVKLIINNQEYKIQPTDEISAEKHEEDI